MQLIRRIVHIKTKTTSETKQRQKQDKGRHENILNKAKWVIGASCRRSLCAARSEDRLPAVVLLLLFAATPCGIMPILCSRGTNRLTNRLTFFQKISSAVVSGRLTILRFSEISRNSRWSPSFPTPCHTFSNLFNNFSLLLSYLPPVQKWLPR